MKNTNQIDKWMAIVVLSVSLIAVQGCHNSPTSAAAPSNVDVNDNVKAEASCCEPETPAKQPAVDSQPPKVEVLASKLTIPDVALIDQDGRSVNLARDVAPDKLLVMNFIFTTCKGVCPPMGVNFGQLQKRLAGRVGKEVSLVSVSVDPVIDTPERLKSWGAQFGAADGWTLLTGQKQDVDHFLKALGVFAANKTEHSPFILIGRQSDGRWQRVHGLTPADKLSEVILGLLASPDTHQAASDSAAEHYFTDVPLVDQHGKELRLYSDILKGKVVVITPFFTTCRGSCPQLLDTFVKLQSHYEDRLGKDLFLVSVTVDPDTDTPDKLKGYAEQYHALPGWYFLTGDKTNLHTALTKLGHRVQAKEDHTNIFIIGNDKTGLWKKAMGLAPPAEIIRVVESVLNDKPA